MVLQIVEKNGVRVSVRTFRRTNRHALIGDARLFFVEMSCTETNAQEHLLYVVVFVLVQLPWAKPGDVYAMILLHRMIISRGSLIFRSPIEVAVSALCIPSELHSMSRRA